MSEQPKRPPGRLGLWPARAWALVGLWILWTPQALTAEGDAAGIEMSSTVSASAAATVSEDDDAIERLIGGLVGSRAVRAECRRRLTEMGADVVPRLLPYATDESFAMRWEIVNLLGSVAAPEGIDALIERIAADEDPHVRWRSMWAIRRIEDATIADRLAQRCDEPSWQGWNACVGLSLFEDRRALPRLVEGLGSSNAWERWEAVDSLGRVFDGSTSAELARGLQDASERVRQETVLSLAQIGDAKALDLLLEGLDDPASAVRWRAAMGLSRRANTAQLEDLESHLAQETDATARKYLQKAIQRLMSVTALGGPASHDPAH